MLELISKYGFVILDDSLAARQLGAKYVNEGIIPAKYRYDGLYIACATVNDLDYIFSLNFQHINKVKTKTLTGFVNAREGYRSATIISPMEV